MSKDISVIITTICKELGIDYQSCNQEYITFYNDAKRLGEIYLELNALSDELNEILLRHEINGLTQLLKDDLETLHKIDHDLIRFANKIKKENDR